MRLIDPKNTPAGRSLAAMKDAKDMETRRRRMEEISAANGQLETENENLRRELEAATKQIEDQFTELKELEDENRLLKAELSKTVTAPAQPEEIAALKIQIQVLENEVAHLKVTGQAKRWESAEALGREINECLCKLRKEAIFSGFQQAYHACTRPNPNNRYAALNDFTQLWENRNVRSELKDKCIKYAADCNQTCMFDEQRIANFLKESGIDKLGYPNIPADLILDNNLPADLTETEQNLRLCECAICKTKGPPELELLPASNDPRYCYLCAEESEKCYKISVGAGCRCSTYICSECGFNGDTTRLHTMCVIAALPLPLRHIIHTTTSPEIVKAAWCHFREIRNHFDF